MLVIRLILNYQIRLVVGFALFSFVATCSYKSYYLLSRNQLKAAIASAYDNGEKVKSLADQALIGEVKTAEDWISEIDAVTTADVTNVRLLKMVSYFDLLDFSLLSSVVIVNLHEIFWTCF